MVSLARVRTVTFKGIDVLPLDVQIVIAPGNIAIATVGLVDKVVGEGREWVQAALRALGKILICNQASFECRRSFRPIVRRGAAAACRGLIILCATIADACLVAWPPARRVTSEKR